MGHEQSVLTILLFAGPKLRLSQHRWPPLGELLLADALFFSTQIPKWECPNCNGGRALRPGPGR